MPALQLQNLPRQSSEPVWPSDETELVNGHPLRGEHLVPRIHNAMKATAAYGRSVTRRRRGRGTPWPRHSGICRPSRLKPEATGRVSGAQESGGGRTVQDHQRCIPAHPRRRGPLPGRGPPRAGYEAKGGEGRGTAPGGQPGVRSPLLQGLRAAESLLDRTLIPGKCPA
jgi:hypothetical protein